MLEFEHLPSVTKKQKRLSTIVSIIVSISVSVISGRLMAKTVWKRVKNRVKEVYATLILRKGSFSYLMAVNIQQLLLQKRSNHEMPLLAHPFPPHPFFEKKNGRTSIIAHCIRSNTTQSFPIISDNVYCNFWIVLIWHYYKPLMKPRYETKMAIHLETIFQI